MQSLDKLKKVGSFIKGFMGIWYDILKHLVIAVFLGIVMVLAFFYVYLPAHTNQGETVTVPDLEGHDISKLEEVVVERDLRYEVTDSIYSSDFPPLAVIRQFPKAGSKVKANRKIFVSVNSVNPPTTIMPDLVDKTIKNAELILKSYELKKGKIITEPDAFRNVLDQKANGTSIKPGDKIAKGTEIDLIVGDGFGIRKFEMPSLLGLPMDEAAVIIKGNNLNIGLTFNDEETVEGGNIVVIKHSPEEGRTVRVGSNIDLWLGDASLVPEAKIDSLSTSGN